VRARHVPRAGDEEPALALPRLGLGERQQGVLVGAARRTEVGDRAPGEVRPEEQRGVRRDGAQVVGEGVGEAAGHDQAGVGVALRQRGGGRDALTGGVQ
jgi:hypothetical protein